MSRTDVHTHLVPALPDAAVAVAGLGRDQGMLTVAERRIGPPALYQPEELVAWLGEVGLERALVSIPPPLYRQELSPADAATWVRAVNDALVAMCAEHSELAVLAYLPLEHPELAVAELQRLAQLPGVVGCTGAAGGRSRSLADNGFEPLWQALVAADRPLLLHPGASPDRRLEQFYLHNLLGNPTETAVAGAELLFSGVLARHRELRIGLVHGGGSLPALLGRWQHGVATSRPGVARPDADLRTEARRLWSDGLTHDRTTLEQATAAFGADHILLGSDWPFPMGLADPMAGLAECNDELADRAAGENAARFLSS